MGKETGKYVAILLLGMGVSSVGAWIYLIALNLMILKMTGSPLAVAALYMIKPLAVVCTNFWAGSLIDRMNKRRMMVLLDIIRAGLIVMLPLFTSIWPIYLLVFFISMANAMFEPTSMSYITRLIPTEQRKRFNSLRSLIDSGGFLIGPAIAGILFIVGTPVMAIYINASAMFISGLVTLLMPDLEKNHTLTQQKLSLELLKQDWRAVKQFSRKNSHVMLIYFLFSCMMVMAAAIDSLEAAFSKEVLGLSDAKYGFLVSIAGAGIVVGAVCNSVLVKKISVALLMSGGSFAVSVGYIVYAFSDGFQGAAIGFFVLSFSLAFANTGFQTFYQNNIPVEVMGRIGSIYGLVEAVIVIIMVSGMGVAAQLTTIRPVVMIGTFIMLAVAVVLFQKSKRPETELVKIN
ncbi:MFS transporter [Virgibacillus kekensis]|uniref:MFS transporter n=1 Tax=Virgibacillus kekensis TaxID=202261 RepID=A0ABV9DN68_9BACI